MEFLQPGDKVYHVSSEIYKNKPIEMTVCDPPVDPYGNIRCEWYTPRGNRIFSAHPRRSLRLIQTENNHQYIPKWKEL